LVQTEGKRLEVNRLTKNGGEANREKSPRRWGGPGQANSKERGPENEGRTRHIRSDGLDLLCKVVMDNKSFL